MIEGVAVKKLTLIPDDRGWLMEIISSTWDVFEKFGRAYVSVAYPNVIKAWHMHKKQTDCLICVKGMAKLVLHDNRENSSTKGETNEFYIGEKNPILVKIPPEVWHGYQALHETTYVINVCTTRYNKKHPDEYRLPPNSDKIPYKWTTQTQIKTE